MPGIVGFTIGSAVENDPQQILRKMQSLIHYQAFYIRDELFCDRNICATRSHTNIVQKQPQPYSDSGMSIWLDGEFYNQDDLTKHSLSEAPSDPAILLSLFKQNTDFSFLKKIDGIYAAVIYDSLQQKIHLITDRYGLRHLYWTVHQGCLAWGSEVKSMLALPGFEPKIDHQAIEDFFSIGHLLGDKTWFEGVELLPSATVLTWDIVERSIQKQCYWSWDEIKSLTGKLDENEIADQLGKLFIDAVERQSREGELVGLPLSGGLDSRAVLSAMLDRGFSIHTNTFGKEGCDDIRIAEMVAKEAGVVHHIFKINSENWIGQRLSNIWWTDGQFNFEHMHTTVNSESLRDYYLIGMSGFLGDAVLGGSYLKDKRFNFFEKLNNRGRRFIREGLRAENVFVHTRIPFFNTKLVEFTLSMPESMRMDSYIYNKMLLRMFPQFFQEIPWQQTGLPISSSELKLKIALLSRKVQYKLPVVLKKYFYPKSVNTHYVDYPAWIRQEPGRSLFESILHNPLALYPQYIQSNKVKKAWEMHLAGKKDCTEYLCLSLTFEIWLQQVFEAKYRTEE